MTHHPTGEENRHKTTDEKDDANVLLEREGGEGERGGGDAA